MKKSPLHRYTPLDRGTAELSRSTPMKKRNVERHEREWVKQFHSEAFVRFTHDRPCVRCGRTPSDPHHEPLRSQGGTWKNVSPVCPDCHTLGPDARHNTSAEAFWASVGKSAEVCNRAHHMAWLARKEEA